MSTSLTLGGFPRVGSRYTADLGTPRLQLDTRDPPDMAGTLRQRKRAKGDK
jgi:hypothetical protein